MDNKARPRRYNPGYDGEGLSGKKTVAVVTESIASLSREEAEAWEIKVVPIPFSYAGKNYLDGVYPTPEEFYGKMDPALPLAATSAPSPGAYMEVFEELWGEGYEVLCVTSAREITRHHEAARMGEQLAREDGLKGRVKVLDSGSAGMSQGLLALEAARLARAGAGMDEVVEKVKTLSGHVPLLLTLDTLEYAVKVARIPRPGSLFVQALPIKPVVLFEHGKVKKIKRARTRRKAKDRLLNLMDENLRGGAPLRVSVQHAGVPEEADDLRNEIAARFEPEHISVNEFSLIMGSQTGPGLLGVAFHEAPEPK